jgi:CSLREA domain-containing protein
MSRPVFLPISAIALLVAAPLAAAELSVNSTYDGFDGVCDVLHCSLRDAVHVANMSPGLDAIHLPQGRMVLSIPGTLENLGETGDLDILDDVVFAGEGKGISIIDADRIDRVIDNHGVHVAFYDLTITGGGNLLQLGDGGGGVLNRDGGELNFHRCAIVDNHVSPTFDLAGGGVLSTGLGEVWMFATTVSGNHAYKGGGIAIVSGATTAHISSSTISHNSAEYAGGGLYLAGVTDIESSTISGNRADMDIGGIWNIGELSIDSSTLSNNTDEEIFSRVATSHVSLVNTIIHGHCDGESDTIDSLSGNLESPGDTCFLALFDLKNVADPMLTPLGDHGGPTLVHIPMRYSPAVDRPLGDANCQHWDQRGVERPKDGDGNFTAVCDIGAVEMVFGEVDAVFIDDFESGSTGAW